MDNKTRKNARPQQQADEIDLLALCAHWLKKWKLLLLGFIAGGLLLGGYTYLQPHTYTSESMIFILSKTTSITSVADLQIGSTLSTDFVTITTSKPVIDTAIEGVKEDMNVELTRKEASKMIGVSNPEDTRILKITVTDTDPKLAQCLCEHLTDAAREQMGLIMQSDEPTLVEAAEVPTEANSNGTVTKAAEGALGGLVIFLIITAIPFLMDDKIKNVDDVENYLGVPVLAVIPYDRNQVYNYRTGTMGGKKKRSKRE